MRKLITTIVLALGLVLGSAVPASATYLPLNTGIVVQAGVSGRPCSVFLSTTLTSSFSARISRNDTNQCLTYYDGIGGLDLSWFVQVNYQYCNNVSGYCGSILEGHQILPVYPIGAYVGAVTAYSGQAPYGYHVKPVSTNIWQVWHYGSLASYTVGGVGWGLVDWYAP